MSQLTFYGYWRSSCSWRVRIALAYKNIPHTYVSVSLIQDGGHQYKPEFFQKNPMAQIPVLEVANPNSQGGSTFLAQSVAILQYLEAIHPSPALVYDDPMRMAQVWQLLELVNSGIQPLQNLSVLDYVKTKLGGDSQVWAAYWIERGLRALEGSVAKTAGRFAVGDQVTWADLCLIPQLYNARRYGVSLEHGFDTLLRVEQACNALEAFAGAHPDRQSDAPKA